MFYTQLPAAFSLQKTIGLRKAKPYAPLAATLRWILFIVSLWVSTRFVSLTLLFKEQNGEYILTVSHLLLLVMWIVVGLLFYTILRLTLKGGALWLLGHARPRFGMCGIYGYVESHVYFCRRRYISLLFLPELLLELILLLAFFFAPPDVLWPLLVVQAVHTAQIGASLLLVLLLLREPKNALFRRMGTLTAVFLP